jgi:hypothetical protein|tara:strand:+ start:390 stop:710 length:321 start_codon:yes stop_codon:yes gene_type:complete
MSSREKEYKDFLSGSPGGYARMGFSNKRRRADKSIIRVLKAIANQKEPRFYEPPALRRERPDIKNKNFLGWAEWERRGRPKIVSYEYPEDIFEWIHRDRSLVGRGR